MSVSKLSLLAVASIIALGSLTAHADSLYLGDGGEGMKFSFNGQTYYNTGGGNYTGSSAVIGGKTVDFSAVYCVDLYDGIEDHHSYNSTIFTTNGVVNNSTVHNAAEIAWLVLNINATTGDQQAGLQAAIWEVEYGDDFTLIGGPNGTKQSIINDETADLALLPGSIFHGSTLISKLDWITPPSTQGWGKGDDGEDWCPDYQQGLVGLPQGGDPPPVPEPATLSLLGTGILGLAGIVRRRMKA